MSSIICPQCGAHNNPDDHKCLQCNTLLGANKRQFQICPSCYQRNPANAEKCGNCALPLDASAELLTDLPQPPKLHQVDQKVAPTVPPTIETEPKHTQEQQNHANTNSNKEEQPANSAQPEPEPQPPTPPKAEIKISESLDPSKESKDRSREDLDWLKMLDLDRDILANQPARSIRSESLTPTDWINTLIPQSDELPKLPETGALQNATAEERLDHSDDVDPENSENDDLNVLDILLNNPAEAEEQNLSTSSVGSAPATDNRSANGKADQPQESNEGLFDIDQLPAEDPLNSWLSDIAADFEPLTDPSPSPSAPIEETAKPEEAAGIIGISGIIEEPKLEAGLDEGEAHLTETTAGSKPYHRGFTGDLIERVEEEIEAESAKVGPESTDKSFSSPPADQTSDAPVGQSPSDETLTAWLAELESDTAAKGDAKEQTAWLDSIEAKPDLENDKLPNWLHEHGKADLAASSTIDALDQETFDDDALEWLIPAEELTPNVGKDDALNTLPGQDEDVRPDMTEATESANRPEPAESLSLLEDLPADATPETPFAALPEENAQPEADTATLSEIESMLDDLIDLPSTSSTQSSEAQDPAGLSQPGTDQPVSIFPEGSSTQAETEAEWLDLNWEEGADALSETKPQAEVPTLPAAPVEPPAEIADMFNEFLAIENEHEHEKETEAADNQLSDATVSDLFQQSGSPAMSIEPVASENVPLESLLSEPELESQSPGDSGILDPEGLLDEMSSLIKEFDTGFLGNEPPPPTPTDEVSAFLADSPAQIDDLLSTEQPTIRPTTEASIIDAIDAHDTDGEIDMGEPTSEQLPLHTTAQEAIEPTAEAFELELDVDVEADVAEIDQEDQEASEDRSLDDILSFLNEQNEFSPLPPDDAGLDDEVTRPNPSLQQFDKRAGDVDLGAKAEAETLAPSAAFEEKENIEESIIEEGFEDLLGDLSAIEPDNVSAPSEEPLFDPFGFDTAQTIEASRPEADPEVGIPADESASSLPDLDFNFEREFENGFETAEAEMEPDVTHQAAQNGPAEADETDDGLFDLFDPSGTEDATMLDLFLDEEQADESMSASDLGPASDETIILEGGNLDIFEFDFDEEMGLGSEVHAEEEGVDLPDFDQLDQPPPLEQADRLAPDLPVVENEALELDMPDLSPAAFDLDEIEKGVPLAEPEPSFDDLFGAEFKEAETTSGEDDLDLLTQPEESDSWLENDLFREAKPDPSLSEVQELEDFTGVFEDASINAESLPDWAKDLKPEKGAPEENRMVIDKARSNPLSGIKNAIEIAPVIAKPIEDLTVVQKLSTMRPQAHNLKAKEIAESVNSPFSGDPTQPIRVPEARQKYQPKFDPTQYDGMSRYKKKEGKRNFWLVFFICCALFLLLAILFYQDAIDAILRIVG